MAEAKSYPTEMKHISTGSSVYAPSFNEIFSTLKIETDCTYLFYLVQNIHTNETIILTSNHEWQSEFIRGELIHHCPYVKFAMRYFSNPNNKEYLTIWNKLPPTTKEEAEVNGIRGEFNIANGLSYTHQKSGIREALGIAGDKKDTDFYRRFLTSEDLIKKTLLHLRELAEIK